MNVSTHASGIRVSFRFVSYTHETIRWNDRDGEIRQGRISQGAEFEVCFEEGPNAVIGFEIDLVGELECK